MVEKVEKVEKVVMVEFLLVYPGVAWVTLTFGNHILYYMGKLKNSMLTELLTVRKLATLTRRLGMIIPP